jgi:hypothetical protein
LEPIALERSRSADPDEYAIRPRINLDAVTEKELQGDFKPRVGEAQLPCGRHDIVSALSRTKCRHVGFIYPDDQ